MSFAGLLNVTGTLYNRVLTPDEYGSSDESVALVASFPVRVRLLNAREREMRGSIGVEATHRIYMQPRVINEKQILLARGNRYELVGVNDVNFLGRVMQVDALLLKDGGR